MYAATIMYTEARMGTNVTTSVTGQMSRKVIKIKRPGHPMKNYRENMT